MDTVQCGHYLLEGLHGFHWVEWVRKLIEQKKNFLRDPGWPIELLWLLIVDYFRSSMNIHWQSIDAGKELSTLNRFDWDQTVQWKFSLGKFHDKNWTNRQFPLDLWTSVSSVKLLLSSIKVQSFKLIVVKSFGALNASIVCSRLPFPSNALFGLCHICMAAFLAYKIWPLKLGH